MSSICSISSHPLTRTRMMIRIPAGTLLEEGIRQAIKASEVFEDLGNKANQAAALVVLCTVLHSDDQLDAAEDTAPRVIRLGPGNCQKAKAIHHFETSINIVLQLAPWTILVSLLPSQTVPRSRRIRRGGHWRTSALSKPNHAQSATHTTWPVRWKPGLEFWIGETGLNMQDPRFHVRSRSLRSSGPQEMQSAAGISSKS